MVDELKNKWRLDPKSYRGDTESISSEDFGKIETIIKIKGEEFTDESYQWVKSDFLTEEEFLLEKKARENLLSLFLLYEKVLKRSGKYSGDNSYLLFSQISKRVEKELDMVVNTVFKLEINGKKIVKRKGESIEHYLMRYIILKRLNDKHGVNDFKEEYSKINEVFETFSKGEAGNKEWEKIAKRADLLVDLNDGSKLWIEVERTRRLSKTRSKLERLKTMLSNYPYLFDKAVFVFSSPMFPMVEATLIGAKEIGFSKDKLEFYEIDLDNNKICHLTNSDLVEVEFGNSMLDWIADGYGQYFKKKTARVARDMVKGLVIVPLLNNEWNEEYVLSKKAKIEELIKFWKKHTRKLAFGALDEILRSEKEVEFKKEALKKIKENYPLLMGKSI